MPFHSFHVAFCALGAGYTVTINKVRTAEVWLDEYKKYFYEAEPYALDKPAGDITERIALRHKLQCKPFSFFVNVSSSPSLLFSSFLFHTDTLTQIWNSKEARN